VTAGAVAVLGALAGTPLQAAGETGTPGGSGGVTCPSSNPPNEMALVAGTPQTTTLGSAFASAFQVALTSSDGCPVTSAAAGIPVTFSAPSSGASGVFLTTASNTATVGADAYGTVAAPPFTADSTAGSYTVTASSQYGSVAFSLTNTAAGTPARIVALPPTSRAASVTSRYPEPLQVTVLDANGNPVTGTTVTFTLGSGGSSACGTSTSSAGATFAGGGTQASATTGATGVASSPSFTANATGGSFTATAAVSGKEPAGPSGRESSGASGSGAATPVSFSLSNLAGKPATLTPGIGAAQSTLAGTPFAIRLAVTVTDAQKNPVSDALITFSAPLAGASGRFTLHARGPHHRARVTRPHTVKVETNTCGIAVAPAFTADDTQGGYIVKATSGHSRPAAFALVNETAGQSP
jgi:protocatechuate 3,4-dioxygenase beta subunit